MLPSISLAKYFANSDKYMLIFLATDKQKRRSSFDDRLFIMMGSQGIEPWTHGLRVRCSAS